MTLADTPLLGRRRTPMRVRTDKLFPLRNNRKTVLEFDIRQRLSHGECDSAFHAVRMKQVLHLGNMTAFLDQISPESATRRR